VRTPNWPLFGLRVVTPRLELRYADDADVDALTTLSEQGVHDPAFMPFSIPWTDAQPPHRARGAMQHYWRTRADFTVDSWTVNFVTVVDGEVVGMQGAIGRDFLKLREVETGSWLGLAHQGKGLGTEMRAAILHFAFDGLSAAYALSGAWHDNHASHGVSRKLGYEEVGQVRMLRRGEPDWMVKLRLPRERWEASRRDDITIEGLDGCLDMFGLV